MHILLAIGFVLALIVSVFAVQNSTSITIEFLFWEFNTSLVMVIMGSTAFGAIITAIFSIPGYMKNKLKIKKLTKKIEGIEDTTV
ncbi:MAG: LapA family protein [Thermodesulfobacteriota bacterium]|nr:LapA family protein [Thermodesulfobacteriota bacterium]